MFGILIIIFSGCSGTIFNIGEPMGSCEETGASFKDTGLCADPYVIYKNRKNIPDEAVYPNMPCRKGVTR